MADIAAGDTTAVILFREQLSTVARGGAPLIIVGLEYTIDPGTDDAYPSGGVLLTNLFTTGNASDTWLDVTMPIVQIGGTPVVRYYDSAAATTITPAAVAVFHNGGATAAAQTLVIYVEKADDGTKSTTLLQHPAEDMSAGTTMTGMLVGADKDLRGRLVLMGFLRPDVTKTGVAW